MVYDESKHKRKGSGSSEGGQFAQKERDEVQVDGLDAKPLSEWTPVEVDSVLSDLSNKKWFIYSDIHKYEGWRDRCELSKDKSQKRLDALSDDDPSRRRWEYDIEDAQKNIDRYQDKIDAEWVKIDALNEEMATYEEEYNRRPWTRAFVCQHIHKSQHCHTLHESSRVYWLPDQSGRTEEEIVDDAGELACTVCYPSAPVDTLRRPTRIETPEARAKREAREEREAKAAAKSAKAAAAGISNPDGSELREPSWNGYRGSVVKTERAAQMWAVDAEMRLSSQSRSAMNNKEYMDHLKEGLKTFTEALAHKREQTYEEVRDDIKKKAAAKAKREKWDSYDPEWDN